MKKINSYKLFESSEDKVDLYFIEDCFIELQDDGVPVKIEAGEVFGHSSVTVMLAYWDYRQDFYIKYEDNKNKVIDNLIKHNKKELEILEKVNNEIDRILRKFDYKVSISDFLYKNDDIDDIFETGYDGDRHIKRLEIIFVKMKQ